MRFCECGCGREVIQKYTYYIPRFVSGHNSKFIVRKPHSEETKRKISWKTKEGMNSILVREKLKRSLRHYWKSERRDRRQHMSIIQKLYVRKIRGKSLEERYGKGRVIEILKNCSNAGRQGKGKPKHTEEHKQHMRELRFNQVMPYKDTYPERVVKDMLVLEGIKFKFQWNIEYVAISDFFLPDFVLLSFVMDVIGIVMNI